MSTDSCDLELEFALVDLAMAALTQGEQIGERIFTPMLSIHQMMRFQTNSLLAALLTLIPIAHQAGQPQVLIQPRRVLIPRPFEIRIVQASYIHLHILHDDVAERQ